MRKIERIVNDIVKKYNCTDPFELCSMMGVYVFFSDLPDATDGVYYSIKGHRIILINDRLNEAERLVAAAHELGHAILHPQSNYAFMTSVTLLLPQKLEREAEIFSAELLLYGLEQEILSDCDITAARIAAEKKVPLRTAQLWLGERGFGGC